MLKILDVEEASSRAPTPNAQSERARILHGARATLDAWQEGRLSMVDAIAALEALGDKRG